MCLTHVLCFCLQVPPPFFLPGFSWNSNPGWGLTGPAPIGVLILLFHSNSLASSILFAIFSHDPTQGISRVSLSISPHPSLLASIWPILPHREVQVFCFFVFYLYFAFFPRSHPLSFSTLFLLFSAPFIISPLFDFLFFGLLFPQHSFFFFHVLSYLLHLVCWFFSFFVAFCPFCTVVWHLIIICMSYTVCVGCVSVMDSHHLHVCTCVFHGLAYGLAFRFGSGSDIFVLVWHYLWGG